MIKLYWLGLVSVLLQLICVLANEEEEDVLSEWGKDKITWLEDIEDAMELAEKDNKPIMVVVHRLWCPACKNLGPKFAQSRSIQKLAKEFHMVNLWGEGQPWQDEYNPDGRYVPRTMFLHPDGTLMREIVNAEEKKKNFYYYDETETILRSMKKVSDMFKDPAKVRASHKENKSKPVPELPPANLAGSKAKKGPEGPKKEL